MSFEYYFDNTKISDEDIAKYPKQLERLSFDNDKIMADNVAIEISNVNRNKYDPRYPGSLLFGTQFYNKVFEIFRGGLVVFSGIVKNIIVNDSNDRLTIVADSVFINLQADCVYSSDSDKTPAEIIYEIITDVAKVDESFINYNSFLDIDNKQSAAGVYMIVNYSKEENQSCMNVISEICRIMQMKVISLNGQITAWQWEEYAGDIGTEIKDNVHISKTYKEQYDDETLINKTYIAYKNGINVSFVEDEYLQTILDQDKYFSVPDEKIDTEGASSPYEKYKILLKSQAAAQYVSSLALKRYQYLKKIFEMQISGNYEFLTIGDQVDLTTDNYIREPARIIEREFDQDNNRIKIKCEFVNSPAEIFDRDKEPPEVPELIAAMPTSTGSVILKWTKNIESDFVYNNVYLTTTPGEWFSESCSLGSSPVRIQSAGETSDGFYFVELRQLQDETLYYFSVSSIDSRLNESEKSNVLSCTTLKDQEENKYNCIGNEFVEGVSISLGSGSGSVPDIYETYSDAPEYDTAEYQPPAFVLSQEYAGNFESITFSCSGDQGECYYRIYQSGTWTDEIKMSDQLKYMLNNNPFRYMLIFRANDWSSTDTIIIKELV